jgi:MFS family permease
VGYHASLLIDTCTFALLVVVGALVRTRRGRRYDAGTSSAPVATAREEGSITGRSVIAGDPLLRLLVPALYLVVLALEAPNVVEVFLITDVFGASAAVYGLVTASFLLGEIVGPLLAARISAEASRLVGAAASAGVVGALIMAIGLSPSVWIVLALFAGCGVAGGMLNALIGTLVVTRTPDHVRGRVLATVTGTARGFSVLAMAIGGLGGQFLGARATFVICGVLGVLAAAMVLRSHRGLPGPATVVEGASPVALQTV